MSRHRSPQGRRAHLGPPLSVALAAAGVGGAHRSASLSRQSLSDALSSSTLSSSVPARFVATIVAGGALAAAGQHALVQTLPPATGGANVLRLGIEELLGTDTGATAADSASSVAPLVALAPVAVPVVPEPAVVGATDLVKAADLQRQAVGAAARAVQDARAAEAAAAAIAAQAAAAGTAVDGPAAVPTTPAGGAVQMVIGKVTSGFGGRWGSMHEGVDIAAPIGTPIRVPLAGTVIDSGAASGFGLWVRVRHADDTITTYGHINRSFVRKGEQVAAGQEIAEVGNRGHSTGPHLHIEVTTPAGRKVNPRPWLDQHGIGY